MNAFLKTALLISLLGLAAANAQLSDRPDGMRFVPDVPAQFQALTERADALGFHIGSSPDPSTCKHYQGMVRVDGADGTPFFLVTRSGNTPDTVPGGGAFCLDSDGETDNGHLIVFRMGSRDKNGERLRSNRLRKGAHVSDTPPPLEDVASIYFTIVNGGLLLQDGEGGPPFDGYQHPGGMQLVGHMLAVAVESPRDSSASPTLIMFFDVSDPEAPVFTSQFAPTDTNGAPLTKSGFVGVTPLPQVPGEPAGRYLAVTTGGADPDHFFFYRSSPDDLSSEALTWEFLGTAEYPDVADAHQTMQFLREGDIHGDLYLAGARGNANTVLHDDRDKIDFRLVVCSDPISGQDDPFCLPGDQISVTATVPSRLITPQPSTGGGRLVNLAAASGFYVSPTGELMMYATEHDNDGPSGTVKAGEWRHINMARDGSPNFLPRVVVNGPYEVDEGGAVELAGSAGPPVVGPWIQLFHAEEFGGEHFSTLYPVVDFVDYDLDDFDDFFTLQLGIHADRTQSWKWYAPEFCSIRAIDHRGNNSIETRILVGDGFLHQDEDLAAVLNDHGDDDMGPGSGGKGVDGVEFLSGCDAYHATPVELQWDLDLNGSFESTGSPVVFSALALDGPTVVQVPARAQDPFGGPPSQTTARVNIRNVAPEIAQFLVTDGAGNEVNVDVPFVLTGLPIIVSAGFSDPGVLDHQTASLAWGDGSVDLNSAFVTFDEAFGDGTGQVVHTHPYALAGSFGITLSLSDDDGGVDAESAAVQVKTPEQAVEEIIDLIDDLIAGTSNSRVRKALEKARKALAGNANGQNGALNKIQNGQKAAAIAFLNQAINRLREAEAGGANVTMLIAILEQVIAALSAA